MILVVGGLASGKKEYVISSLGYTPEQIADGVLNACPVVYNLQDMIKDDPSVCLSLLPELLKKEVVICNEVGSGVIPFTPEGRDWREATGRLCINLAKQANKVVRLVCGVPVVIKGE